MTIKTAYVELRSQHSKGSSSGNFGGPDTYVAVQIAPMGVEPLKVLNRKVAKSRGISIRYFGEGYGRSTTVRSMLGQAKLNAENFADEFNEAQGRAFNRAVHEGFAA